MSEITKYSILKKYWGYSEFREGQANVIDSILKNTNTLAVLATGTGKSICYQIPGLIKEGTTLVVSPLIALIKDQIRSLRERGIKAEGLYSGQSRKDQDRIIDNTAYGDIKFLFVSPERLRSRLLLDRLDKLNIGLLVIDEAHCISEWGHDFRPSYRLISEFHQSLTNAPILCLTATATDKVINDILQNLKIEGAQKVIYSPIRPNISYKIFATENKQELTRAMLSKIKYGSVIVYVKSRKLTKSLQRLLSQHAIKAEAFHGGLTMKEREGVIEQWESGKVSIIVATKAFGMGIDKSDVRLVIHYEIPDSIEAYVQEAGRAGRDQKKANAVLLTNLSDVNKLQDKRNDILPDVPFIHKIYKTLGIYLKIASGETKERFYNYNHIEFCESNNLPKFKTLNALRILHKHGTLNLSENILSPSKLMFDEGGIRQTLSSQRVSPVMKNFIKLLLRTYEGLYLDAVAIDEKFIANRFKETPEKVREGLLWLRGRKVAFYKTKEEGDLISFNGFRFNKDDKILDQAIYNQTVIRHDDTVDEITKYIYSENCRQAYISNYFGFKKEINCGSCDNCSADSNEEIKASYLITLIKLEINDLRDIYSHFTLKYRDTITKKLKQLESERRIKIVGSKVELNP